MNDKISIIVPAYNIANCLASSLDSILAQTHSNIEVIVVNDGSEDHTGKVVDQYAEKDARIKAIHKENGGVTSARLRGLQEATGEWIGFVDGDDLIESGMYQRLLENAKSHEADISHCGYQMVFPNGRVDYYYNTGRIVKQYGLQGCQDLLTGTFVEPGLCNKLFRRDLFEGLDTWMDVSIKINEDLLMNYYLFKKAARSIYEDFCPYHYLLRKGSAATSKLNAYKLRDPLRVTRIIQADADTSLQPVLRQRLIRQLIVGATMKTDDQAELVIPYRQETRQELRHQLKNILTKNECSKKLKLMALWAAVWPASYSRIHELYSKITGLDKIYDLE